MNKVQNTDNQLYNKVVSLLNNAKQNVATYINKTMVITYFEIGKLIVEEQQNGIERAGYGESVLINLSKMLTQEFGKGFSTTNLKQMRSFYIAYKKGQTVSDDSKKGQTLSDQSKEFNLSWSHYLTLMRIENQDERRFYEIESIKNNWSVRELKRQYDSALYIRLTLSKDKKGIKDLSKNGIVLQKANDLIKDPYILEFLGLPESNKYTENDLEQSIIDKLEHFLLELGNGFTFVARQKRISFDDKHFYIDLVFYNRMIKSFVLIDLKIGELKHQDIGQMQMYVNYYDRKIKLDDENNTIGIILCQNKSEAVVKFTLPEDNTQIFASKYLTVLPTKDEFKKILENN